MIPTWFHPDVFTNGYILTILIPLALAVVLSGLRYGGRPNTTGSFYVADRNEPTPLIAISIAAAWIWTVALYVLPPKIYEFGIIAAVPFVLVNALCVVLLGWLVPRVRAVCADVQLTLPQFGGIRDGKRTEGVLTAAVLGAQIYSVITHLLGAALLLTFMPNDFNKPTLIVILAVGFLMVAAIRGMQSSIPADIVKYAVVGGVVVVAFVLTLNSGGTSAIEGGIAGLRAQSSGLVDAKTIWQMVIPTSMGLFSAVAMDDQLYQRGFATRNSPRAAYLLGALLFLVIATGMGMLGFLAADKPLGVTIGQNEHQLVNFLTIEQLMPKFPMYLLVTAFMASLIASGGAALHAAGNVGAKNVTGMLFPNFAEKHSISVSRVTMLVTLGLGILLAVWNSGIFELWMGWNVFRAALFFPIIALVVMSREKIPSVFWWIVVDLACALGTFGFSWYEGAPVGIASGYGILAAWGIGSSLLALRMVKVRFLQTKFA
jgi:Na+/proline symporter